ncbi:hypothetical protein [Nitratifractor salsuginis]|nr:hypothetical protein [Nitratifractor salsuginis]
MKKLLFILAGFLLLSSFAVAAGWLHDYEEALEKAQKEHKLVLMIYVKKG